MSEWKVEKRVDITAIMTLLALIGSILVWGIVIERQISSINANQLAIEKDIEETRTLILRVEKRLLEKHQ